MHESRNKCTTKGTDNFFLYIDDSASERATVVVVVVVARSRILALIRTRYDRYLKRNP